jgi:predicted metal-dependent phosphoesterase TrpH
MTTDIYGKTRYRVNLHTHTTRSDGKKTPEEAAKIYREAGYDAITLTDHWCYGESFDQDGLLVLSGVEYNIKNTHPREGLFHIVGVGMTQDPCLDDTADAQAAIDAIKSADGLAIIAHPAWSLNTPEQIMKLRGGDVTEIYNSVSGVHMSRRPDSGVVVEMLGAQGVFYPLVADDDTHYYDNDACVSYIEVAAESCTRESLLAAIRKGDFYATQGPEVHLRREGDEMVVTCSPCCEIVFLSDWVWSRRVFEGEGITEARYKICDGEHFIRAEVVDKDGKRGWTNCVIL